MWSVVDLCKNDLLAAELLCATDSDDLFATYDLWVGLCIKVEVHTLTTERAQTIFENFKWGIIESIKAQEGKSEKEAT